MTDDKLDGLAAAVDEALEPATFEALRDVWPTGSQSRSSRAEPGQPAPPNAEELIAKMRANGLEDPDTT
ncbi:hypothetical protein [Actinomycetospora flava]|uniref:Uncharacterized protein n=1 Tax=Actinomycetospora flava TaxID=3129232 RepID=A0ABU8MDJ5_9PSEU